MFLNSTKNIQVLDHQLIQREKKEEGLGIVTNEK